MKGQKMLLIGILLCIITIIGISVSLLFKIDQFIILANIVPLYFILIIFLSGSLSQKFCLKKLIYYFDISFIVVLFYGIILSTIEKKSETTVIGWEPLFIITILEFVAIILIPLNIVFFILHKREKVRK